MVEGQFSSPLPARPLLLLLLAAPVTLAVVGCEGGRAGLVITDNKEDRPDVPEYWKDTA